MSRLIKPGDIILRKTYSVSRDFSWIENHKLTLKLECVADAGLN